jgi:hypothetical protein
MNIPEEGIPNTQLNRDAIKAWAESINPEDYVDRHEWHVTVEGDGFPEPVEIAMNAEYPPARNFEQRQADRLANIYKRRHFEHMTIHGMSSMPRHVRLRPVRGGCFVDVFYTYAFIQMPFDSIRIARKYVKYMGLPLQKGE